MIVGSKAVALTQVELMYFFLLISAYFYFGMGVLLHEGGRDVVNVLVDSQYSRSLPAAPFSVVGMLKKCYLF